MELFNFCFPVDYRQRVQLKLENYYQQGNQPVSEYVCELEEMFSMVGAMPADMKTVKLWYSLKTRTQRALWRDGLHLSEDTTVRLPLLPLLLPPPTVPDTSLHTND